MNNKINKFIIAPVLTLTLVAVSVPVFASPWGPKQVHRENKLHHVRHHMHRQERKADRALSNGNLAGYFRHEERANELHDRAHHIHHKINRSNRRWAHRHGW